MCHFDTSKFEVEYGCSVALTAVARSLVAFEFPWYFDSIAEDLVKSVLYQLKKYTSLKSDFNECQ